MSRKTHQPNPFDALADHFIERIDSSFKGRLRRQQIHRDLYARVLQRENGPLNILDVGGGTGRTAQWLLSVGKHRLIFVEPAQPLLHAAAQRLCQEAREGRVELLHSDLDGLKEKQLPPLDMVLAHAVLEWLPDPDAGLMRLQQLVRPGGYLSVAVYNTPGRRIRQITRGEVTALQHPLRPGSSKMAPLHSFHAEDLDACMQRRGWQRLLFAGLRTVSDLLPAQRREKLALDTLNKLDEAYRHHSPFRELSTYVHLIWKSPG